VAREKNGDLRLNLCRIDRVSYSIVDRGWRETVVTASASPRRLIMVDERLSNGLEWLRRCLFIRVGILVGGQRTGRMRSSRMLLERTRRYGLRCASDFAVDCHSTRLRSRGRLDSDPVDQ
jgi:hypothetical protein